MKWDGVGLHRQLESNLADIAQRGKKAARKGIRLGHKVSMTNKQATASYFWNCTCTVAAPHGLLMYWPNAHLRLCMADNTVEMVLLGCAVLVNLAGVMFESNRFQSEHFNDQRDGVTIFIMMVIIASIVYYVTVVTSEIYVTLYPEKSSRGCWYAARHLLVLVLAGDAHTTHAAATARAHPNEHGGVCRRPPNPTRVRVVTQRRIRIRSTPQVVCKGIFLDARTHANRCSLTNRVPATARTLWGI